MKSKIWRMVTSSNWFLVFCFMFPMPLMAQTEEDSSTDNDGQDYQSEEVEVVIDDSYDLLDMFSDTGDTGSVIDSDMAPPLEELTSPDDMGLTLEDCVNEILHLSPEVKEKEWGIRYYEGLYDEAWAGNMPKLNIMAYAVPTPNKTGDVNKSETHWDKWNVYGRFESLLLWPIYTFGRISSGKEAALAGIQVSEAEKVEVEWQVKTRVKELYYGYLLAMTLKNRVVALATEFLEEAIKTAQESIDSNSGEISNADFSKLRIAKVTIAKYEAMANKYYDLTSSALKAMMGMSEEEEFKTRSQRIEMALFELKPLAYYQNLVYQTGPLWLMAQSGVRAYEGLADLARADYYPILGVVLQFDAGWAPGYDDIDSTFAYDPYNEIFGGGGIGLLWNFDPFTTMARVDQAEAEYQQVVSKKEFAEMGLKILVQEAYETIVEKRTVAEAAREGSEIANQWFTSSAMAYNSGLEEAKNVLEGLAAFATTTYDYYQAVYDYNMACARLSALVGQEITEID